jgi:hypothetical protein
MNVQLPSLTAALAFLVTSQAQPFEVQTTFIGAPAGVIRNSAFTVSGVIGQPESGTLAGDGAFTVEGGWPAPLIIESAGAPTLLITLDRNSGAVTVAWPATANGHVLEANADLNDPSGWIDVSETPSEVGTHLEVAVQPNAQAQYYRLRRAN